MSVLVDRGINTAQALRQASDEQRVELAEVWQKTRGLGSASWDYLTMNAGVEDIKVDRMIRRFFERAIGDLPHNHR